MEFTLEVRNKNKYAVHKFKASTDEEIMREVLVFLKMIGLDNVDLDIVVQEPPKSYS